MLFSRRPCAPARLINRRQSGMTLIEIMIVLVILGSIATFLVTQVTGSLEKAKVREAKILLQSVTSALDMYYTDCHDYPSDLGSLLTAASDCKEWGPEPYIKKMPKDPWNRELVYERDGNSFILTSLGKDGKEGGDGYDKDISTKDAEEKN